MFDFETFQNAYKNAPEQLKSIIDGPDIPNAINQVLPQLGGEQRHNVTRGIARHVLGILNEEELLVKLKELGVEIDGTTLKKIVPSLNAPQTQDPSSPVTPVRTMENDMAAAQEGQTYISSQDALLNNKVGEVPKPNDTPHA